MGFFKNWDDRGSLERSLRVAHLDFNVFFQKYWDDWGSLEHLRMLATGSECGILSKIGMMWGPYNARYR